LTSANDPDQLAQKESVVRYLTDFHGLPSLQDFTERDLGKIHRDIHQGTVLGRTRWEKKAQLRDSAFSLLNIDQTEAYSRPVSLSATNKLVESGDFSFV